MKKLYILFITLCLFLCSCKGIETKPATLEASVDIPENGIINAEIFDGLKENNKICVFNGENNSIKYSWVIFGNKIGNIRDYNLKVEITDETTDSLTFKVFDDFDFEPKLSIHLSDTHNGGDVSVTDEYGNELQSTLTSENNTVLNISLTKSGTYFAKFNLLSEQDNQSENISNSDGLSSSDKSQNVSDKSNSDSFGNSDTTSNPNVIYSDGNDTKQDKYLTDPVPEGKPMPVDKETSSETTSKDTPPKQFHCTLSVECSSILNNIEKLNKEKLDVLPSDGIILKNTDVVFTEGESVYDVLSRVCTELGIHIEASFTPMYNSYYIEGIANLYEFDCGEFSGWMYRVNNWYPNYGCSRYAVKDGDKIEFRYTCDLGNDIDGGYFSD